MNFSVLYEDNHVLVVCKPSGLLTQPSGTERDNLEDQLKAWLVDKYKKPGNAYLHAIHRLDKVVSGIVVFAKTSKALARLNEAMREKQTKKCYHALVEGTLKAKEGIISSRLSHDEFKATVQKTHETKNHQTKDAKLFYRLMKQAAHYALVEIYLDTGRYHQIRAQMADIAHPILGDQKYGSQIPFLPNSIALHHYCFEFPHPITQETIHVEAPYPVEWKNWVFS